MTYYVHIITVSYTVISDKITSKATGKTITRIKLSLLCCKSIAIKRANNMCGSKSKGDCERSLIKFWVFPINKSMTISMVILLIEQKGNYYLAMVLLCFVYNYRHNRQHNHKTNATSTTVTTKKQQK